MLHPNNACSIEGGDRLAMALSGANGKTLQWATGSKRDGPLFFVKQCLFGVTWRRISALEAVSDSLAALIVHVDEESSSVSWIRVAHNRSDVFQRSKCRSDEVTLGVVMRSCLVNDPGVIDAPDRCKATRIIKVDVGRSPTPCNSHQAPLKYSYLVTELLDVVLNH